MLTLGTLAVIVVVRADRLLSVAKPVRDQTATIELPTDLGGAVGELT